MDVFTKDENTNDKDEKTELFPTAESDQDLQKAQKKTAFRMFCSSRTFQTLEMGGERPDLRADLIAKNKAFEHYRKGAEAMSRTEFTVAVTLFSKAISLQPKQAQLFLSRAEAYLQLCDFQSAALSYRQACFLEPQSKDFQACLAFTYYLQGQCLYDQGMYLEALESFTKAVEVKPSCWPYHMRSLACLTALGRYSDCLRLVNTWLETDTQTADLFTLRARLHRELRRMTSCYRDLRAALALSAECSEARAMLAQLVEDSKQARQEAVSRAVAGRLQAALGKINTALEHSPEDANHYLFRGILYRRLKDFTAAIEDLALVLGWSQAGAEALREEALREEARAQLVLTYSDFAAHCFSCGFHSEAAMLLTKAIDEQKQEKDLYVWRGDCFFKLGEWDFALADYQQAEEMNPDDQATWVRLAVIHNTLGLQNYQEGKNREAADKFSAAIRYEPRETLYFQNRAKAYYQMADLERAREDAISSLILNHSNDQVEPLLLSLFPGCSIPKILSSEMARELSIQLNHRIRARWETQDISAVSRPPGGPDQGSSMQVEVSRSEGHSVSTTKVSGTALKFCVTQKDVYKELTASKQMVNREVTQALRQRLPLHYDGPRLAPLAPVAPRQQDLNPSDLGRPYRWRKFRGLGLNFS